MVNYNYYLRYGYWSSSYIYPTYVGTNYQYTLIDIPDGQTLADIENENMTYNLTRHQYVLDLGFVNENLNTPLEVELNTDANGANKFLTQNARKFYATWYQSINVMMKAQAEFKMARTIQGRQDIQDALLEHVEHFLLDQDQATLSETTKQILSGGEARLGFPGQYTFRVPTEDYRKDY